MSDKSSKADGLRAMREATYAANHSRGDGLRVSTSRQAKVGSDQPADVGAASSPREANPVAKATKAKPSGLDAKGPSKTPVTPADRVASRLGAGRTAQDSPQSETAGAVAIRKPGRPKIVGPRPWEATGVSKATYYRDRRRAEGKAK